MLTVYLILLIISIMPKPVQLLVNCPTTCRNGALHTVCIRTSNCGPTDRCTEVNMDKLFRYWLTKAHNVARDQLAVDYMVANMLALTYDNVLEYVARCWANTCRFQKDKCRVTSRFPEWVGQNVAKKKIIQTEGHIEEIVDEWFANGTADTKWAQTSHLGCGISKTYYDYFIIVCNYGVPGGKLQDRGYIHGYTTTKCETGASVDYKFRNLCRSSSSLIISSDTECLVSLSLIVFLKYIFC